MFPHFTLDPLTWHTPRQKKTQKKEIVWIALFGWIWRSFMLKKFLNVRQKLGTRSHSLTVSHSLTLVILNNFCFHVYAQKSLAHSHTISLSHSLNVSLSRSHSFTLSFTHSPHAEQLLFSCLCSKVTLSHSLTLSHSHSLPLPLSHSHTLTLSHYLTWVQHTAS